MDRYPDSSGLISQSSGHGLTNPPGRICTQLISFCIIKLLDTLDQAKVSLLNQIQEAHASSGVALGDADNQTQVGLNEPVLCMFVAVSLFLGQFQLFISSEKRDCTNLFQVHADRVFRADAFQKVNGIQIDVLLIGILHETVIHIVVYEQCVLRQDTVINHRDYIDPSLFQVRVDLLHLFCGKIIANKKVIDLCYVQRIVLSLGNLYKLAQFF